MKKCWEYFKTEFLDRVCSSKKRIIKFIVICLVPFLYGFICIWAFWNPLDNIGKAPMAIVNQSKSVPVIIKSEINKKPIQVNSNIVQNLQNNNNLVSNINFGIITYYIEINSNNQELIGEPISVKNIVESNKTDSFYNFVKNSNNDVAVFTYDQTYVYGNQKLTIHELNSIKQKSKPIIVKKSEITSVKLIPDFSIVRDYFNWWKKHPNSENIIQYNKTNDKYSIILSSEREWNEKENKFKLIPKKVFDNVQYLENEKANEIASFIPNSNGVGKWKVNNDKYWYQVQVPNNFNANIISFLSLLLKANNQNTNKIDYFLTQLKNSPINIWTTFKKSFLFGQFMKLSSEFKSAILLNMVPNLFIQTISTGIENTLNKNGQIDKTAFFQGTNNILEIDGNKIPLENNEWYLIKDQAILEKINKNTTNLSNFPTLNNVKKTFIGTNSYANSISNIYKNLTNSLFNKRIINFFINLFFIDNILGKPYKLNDEQLNKLFGTESGISSILELDDVKLNSLRAGLVTIPNTNISIEWNEFSKKFIHSLQKNVGIVKIFGENSVISYNKLNSIYSQNISSVISFYATGATKIRNIDGIITNNLEGDKFSIYGIGLGQFFLCIGVWVGVLMQTFIYDRNIRKSKKIEPVFEVKKNQKSNLKYRLSDAMSWWFAKNALMNLTTFIQVTFLMITVGLLGWFSIGPSFGLLYLSILFSGFIWTAFIQSLWYLFRDEVIGKFIVIIFLIINISSGWGTFPPLMQFQFFQIISNIAPFTYCIKNQGLIIYGISTNGINSLDTLSILKYCGIQLIYLLMAFSFSLYESLNLQKIIYFGNSNSKKMAKVLKQLNYDSSYFIIKKTKNKEIVKINWNQLDWKYNKTINETSNKMFISEKQFKFYEKKFKCLTFDI